MSNGLIHPRLSKFLQVITKIFMMVTVSGNCCPALTLLHFVASTPVTILHFIEFGSMVLTLVLPAVVVVSG